MNPYRSIVSKLTRIYAFMTFGLLAAMNGYNVAIDGSTWSHVFRYDFYFVLAGNLAVFAALAALTRVRLRAVKRYFEAGGQAGDQADALRSLLRLPAEVGFALLAGCVLLSACYHFAEIALFRIRPLGPVVLRHVLIELSAGATVAMLFHGIVRRIAAPCAALLAKKDMVGMRRTSLFWPWLGAFASLLAVACLMLIWSVINWEGMGGVRLPIVLAVCLFTFLFGLFVIRMMTSGLLRDIRALTRGMQVLHDHPADRRIIPVTSSDETGQLAEAFNALQDQMEREYAGIRDELKLAYQVQQRLLPPPKHEIGCYRIVCHSRPARQVGGDLYDVLRLSEHRFAIAIGDVSGKGLSAALVMSAVITLFRMEARRGGSAAETMTRLNGQLSETLRGSMMVTLGIGLFDSRSGALSYASGGHLAPYVIARDGGVRPCPYSSLPLGFDADGSYREERIELAPGECLVLYTDGVIERTDESGSMFGFERLEGVLAGLPPGGTPEARMDRIRTRMQAPGGIDEAARIEASDDKDDDWTLMLIQRSDERGGPHA